MHTNMDDDEVVVRRGRKKTPGSHLDPNRIQKEWKLARQSFMLMNKGKIAGIQLASERPESTEVATEEDELIEESFENELEEATEIESRGMKVIQELIDTEKNYIEHLQEIIK